MKRHLKRQISQDKLEQRHTSTNNNNNNNNNNNHQHSINRPPSHPSHFGNNHQYNNNKYHNNQQRPPTSANSSWRQQQNTNNNGHHNNNRFSSHPHHYNGPSQKNNMGGGHRPHHHHYNNNNNIMNGPNSGGGRYSPRPPQQYQHSSSSSSSRNPSPRPNQYQSYHHHHNKSSSSPRHTAGGGGRPSQHASSSSGDRIFPPPPSSSVSSSHDSRSPSPRHVQPGVVGRSSGPGSAGPGFSAINNNINNNRKETPSPNFAKSESPSSMDNYYGPSSSSSSGGNLQIQQQQQQQSQQSMSIARQKSPPPSSSSSSHYSQRENQDITNTRENLSQKLTDSAQLTNSFTEDEKKIFPEKQNQRVDKTNENPSIAAAAAAVTMASPNNTIEKPEKSINDTSTRFYPLDPRLRMTNNKNINASSSSSSALVKSPKLSPRPPPPTGATITSPNFTISSPQQTSSNALIDSPSPVKREPAYFSDKKKKGAPYTSRINSNNNDNDDDNNQNNNNKELVITTTYPDDFTKKDAEKYQHQKHLLIYHSCPLPPEVSHVINTEYPENCPKPKSKNNTDPCGCAFHPLGSCKDLSCVLFACNEECRTNCVKSCQNNRIRDRKWKMLEVFDAGPKGRGLRPLEDVKKDDLVVEYVGVATKKKDLDYLFSQYSREPMLYIMALSSNIFVDARTKGGIARYINHGCDPNCKVMKWQVRGVTRAGVFALRDIKKGEELCFDYQWDRRRGRAPTKCYCGSPLCRGTLEVPKEKDIEEEEMEMKLRGFWKKPSKTDVGKNIINRVIKVYFEGNHEYFVGDVCQYDESSNKHMVIYKTDNEEAWENLSNVEWMILDEQAEHFVIKRRAGHSNNEFQPPQFIRHTQEPKKEKNYVILQPHIREALKSKFILDKCQRYFRVQINAYPCVRGRENVPEEERLDEEKALDESQDGKAWKHIITGLDPAKAIEFIEKNMESILTQLSNQVDSSKNDQVSSSYHQSSIANSSFPHSSQQGNTMHILEHQFQSHDANMVNGSMLPSEMPQITQEIIYPRAIVDRIKPNLARLKKNIGFNVILKPIKSSTAPNVRGKEKTYARLLVKAPYVNLVMKAQNLLWDEILIYCSQVQDSISYYKIHDERGNGGNNFIEIPSELGFLGGYLTVDQWNMFLNFTQDHNAANNDKNLKEFQQKHKCTLWAVPDETTSNSSSLSIFIGCKPTNLVNIWSFIQNRVKDVEAGVCFLSLPENIPANIIRDSFLCEQNPRWAILSKRLLMDQHPLNDHPSTFLDFVRIVTGAKISLDKSTGTHLRIDGTVQVDQSDWDAPTPMEALKQQKNRIRLATNIVNVQLNLCQDAYHRQSKHCLYGRDWSLCVLCSSDSDSPEQSSNNVSSSNNRTTMSGSINDLCDIIEELGLNSAISAHAVLIYYRYISQCSQKLSTRELITSCVFLACKAQKLTKWKKLEVVLQASYKVFYSVTLELDSEEAKQLHTKIIGAEKTILNELKYDVFWSGIDWIYNLICDLIDTPDKGKSTIAKDAYDITLHPLILSLGPTAWLKCGTLHIYLAVLGLFRNDLLPNLFSYFKEEVDPRKIQTVAQLINDAIAQGMAENYKSKRSKNDVKLLTTFMEKVPANLPVVNALCGVPFGVGLNNTNPHQFNGNHRSSHSIKWNQVLQEMKDLSCCFQKVLEPRKSPDSVLQTLHPLAPRISAETNCAISLAESIDETTVSVILEGSWRSVTFAETMLNLVNKQNENSNPPIDSEKNDTSMSLDHYSPSYFGAGLGGAQVASSSSTTSNPSSNNITHHKIPSKNGPLSSNKSKTMVIGNRCSNSQLHPSVLNSNQLHICKSWDVSQDFYDEPINNKFTNKIQQSYENKPCLSGIISTEHMMKAGLKYWIQSYLYVPGQTGSLCDTMILNKFLYGSMEGLSTSQSRANLPMSEGSPKHKQQQFHMKINQFKEMFTIVDDEQNIPSQQYRATEKQKAFVDISFQRWPLKKIEVRERANFKSNQMNMGFSAAALQEMQLLTQFHGQIALPQGHPNFFLPIAICIPSTGKEDEKESKKKEDENFTASSDFLNFDHHAMMLDGPGTLEETLNVTKSHFLLSERTPISLQKILSRSKRRNADGVKESLITPSLFSAWFYDLLLILGHAHSNHVILRMIHPDQILINRIGEIKYSNLARTVVLSQEERVNGIDPLSTVSSSKKSSEEKDESSSNPYLAPEMLLGATKYTKESDTWSIGCLVVQLLLNKSLFQGETRHAHTKSIFKVVGTPSKENYPRATKYPNYDRCKLSKEYKPNVGKAIRHYLRNSPHNSDDAIDLLEKMLQLDPKKRISPLEALNHKFIRNFVNNLQNDSFRMDFSRDWMNIKSKMMEEEPHEINSSKKKANKVSLGLLDRQHSGKINLNNSHSTSSSKKHHRESSDPLYDFSLPTSTGNKRFKHDT